MQRKASAVWRGTGAEGAGEITTTSGALSGLPYTFKARFVSEDGTAGTNPEELIAAAHAACFNMALAFQVVGAGFTADELRTEAVVDMQKEEAGWRLKSSTLHLSGRVPGLDRAKFMELAEAAKKGCPISNALGALDVRLEATFDEA